MIETAAPGEKEDPVVAAATAGDEPAFTLLVARHAPEIRAHCYRIVRSREEAEDVVQETFLRAWRKRASFAGRSTFRTWLYRIATNVCLDTLRRGRRRPVHLGPAGRDGEDEVPASEAEPDAAVVGRETLELVLLAAIQHLPARQRAVLVLRDTLGWSARDTASLLGTSVAAANSALQRARATMATHWPVGADRVPASAPTDEERALLRRFVEAHDRADAAAVAALTAPRLC